MPQGDSAILKNGAKPHGALSFAITATPQESSATLASFPVGHFVHVGAFAVDALRSIAPPLLFYELHGYRLIHAGEWELHYHR